VTLIGTLRQHVLAEANRSLSLVSECTDDGSEEELWFGNASLPRSQGISETVLNAPEYTAVGPKGQVHTAPALVISNMTNDDRFKSNAYARHGVTFYRGVPIISKTGHCIGVYTITDGKPRDGLTLSELVSMQDMAKTVMRHLDIVQAMLLDFEASEWWWDSATS
jgi:GAF domain-containing protein